MGWVRPRVLFNTDKHGSDLHGHLECPRLLFAPRVWIKPDAPSTRSRGQVVKENNCGLNGVQDQRTHQSQSRLPAAREQATYLLIHADLGPRSPAFHHLTPYSHSQLLTPSLTPLLQHPNLPHPPTAPITIASTPQHQHLQRLQPGLNPQITRPSPPESPHTPSSSAPSASPSSSHCPLPWLHAMRTTTPPASAREGPASLLPRRRV